MNDIPRHDPYRRFRDVLEQYDELPCTSYPDAFFNKDATDTTGPSYDYFIAKSLCAKCPIILECLDYALEANEEYGVWGSLTPNERKKLKAKKARGGKNVS